MYRKYSINDLKLEDEDLQMILTMGVTISGTWLDLLSLRNYIKRLEEFNLIYNTISNDHLRIVKVDEFEKFLEWRGRENSIYKGGENNGE